MKSVRSLLLGVSCFALACEKANSHLQDHALADDTAGTLVGRLIDGDRVSAYLKTNSSYYRLECSSLLGLEQLIKGFGYPIDQVKNNPTLTYDQFLAQPGAQGDFAFSCDLGTLPTARLVHLTDLNKYFISLDSGNGSRFNLRMLGCASAIGALGFDMTKALPITADNYEIFKGTDSLDINCYAGEKPQIGNTIEPYQLQADKLRLLRIRGDVPGTFEFAFSTGTKGFRLDCANDRDGSRRLAALGADLNLAFLSPLLAYDSDPVVSANVFQNKAITCDDSSASLKSIDWPAGKKYYLFYKKVKDKAVLHEVGCREIVEFVNPQLLGKASAIAPETAEAFYSYSDHDKFECLKGTAL